MKKDKGVKVRNVWFFNSANFNTYRQIKIGRSTSQGQGIIAIEAYEYKNARCDFIANLRKMKRNMSDYTA